jgi:methylenetetrahydrofolate dehydrogenase (NADP+)/methenyltetrahydrofolate cyclohydrolase
LSADPPSHAAIETVVFDGKALADSIRGELAEEINELTKAGHRPPCLAVVLVGDDPASCSYIKGKQRACARIGMDAIEHILPDSTSQQELLDLVAQLNADDGIDGILVQLPLPDAIDPAVIAEAVDPEKDADALHPTTSGRLVAGSYDLASCTPLGILACLDHHGIELEGANAVVIGRSQIVGKPIALLLQLRNATVTMCHSRTRDLQDVCRGADVLVVAAGRPRMVGRDWIKPGAAVIDVGVTEVDGKLVGDVDFEAAMGVAGLLTPPRRGIGPMTVTMLLRNTLHAYRKRKGL